MPKFIMDDSGVVLGKKYSDLTPFVQGYIEAMLFTETSCIPMAEWYDPKRQKMLEEGQMDGTIPQDAGFGDIHPDSLASAIADCQKFQSKASELLTQAYGHMCYGGLRYDEKRAGHDFWFTRNRHGVGYWDRDLGDIGSELTDIADSFPELSVSFYEDDSGEESPTGYGFVFIY